MEGDIKYVRAAAVRLILLAKDYAPKEDGDVLRRKMMMEILLKALPKDTAKYIREKEPGDVFATMDLASRHMAREGVDEFKFTTARLWTHTRSNHCP